MKTNRWLAVASVIVAGFCAGALLVQTRQNQHMFSELEAEKAQNAELAIKVKNLERFVAALKTENRELKMYRDGFPGFVRIPDLNKGESSSFLILAKVNGGMLTPGWPGALLTISYNLENRQYAAMWHEMPKRDIPLGSILVLTGLGDHKVRRDFLEGPDVTRFMTKAGVHVSSTLPQ